MSDTQSDNVGHCSHKVKLAHVSAASFLGVAMTTDGRRSVPATTDRCRRCEPAAPVSSGRPSLVSAAVVSAGGRRLPHLLYRSHRRQNAIDLHRH